MNKLTDRIEAEDIPIISKESEEQLEEKTLTMYEEIRRQSEIKYGILIG